jgi:hypothetical protein
LLEKATLTIPKPKIYQELATQGKVFKTDSIKVFLANPKMNFFD